MEKMEPNWTANKKTRYDTEIQDLLISTRMPFCSRVGKLIAEKDLKIERYRIVATALIDLEKTYEQSQNELIRYKQRFGEIK